MAFAQIAVKAGGKLGGLALERAPGVGQQYGLGLAFNQAAHHGARAHAADVSDDRAELDAGILQIRLHAPDHGRLGVADHQLRSLARVPFTLAVDQ